MTEQTVYVLELRPSPADPTPLVTLRRALKNLLRGFGLRCVSVSERSGNTVVEVSQSPLESTISPRGDSHLTVTESERLREDLP